MKDWWKAYWMYRTEKQEIKLDIDWFSFFFWLTISVLIIKEWWK